MPCCCIHWSYLNITLVSSSTLDGLDDEGTVETVDGATSDGFLSSARHGSGGGHVKETKATSHRTPMWLSCSTPDEFIVRSLDS